MHYKRRLCRGVDFCFEEKCVGLRTRFASYGKSLNDMAKIAKADPVSGATGYLYRVLIFGHFFSSSRARISREEGAISGMNTFLRFPRVIRIY